MSGHSSNLLFQFSECDAAGAGAQQVPAIDRHVTPQ
jgi:hypothetical protein